MSPRWVDTSYKVYEGPEAFQQSAGRVGHVQYFDIPSCMKH